MNDTKELLLIFSDVIMIGAMSFFKVSFKI